MLDGKNLNLGELSAKLDEDDIANGKPKGDSVQYYTQMVDSFIDSKDTAVLFSQEGSKYIITIFKKYILSIFSWRKTEIIDP